VSRLSGKVMFSLVGYSGSFHSARFRPLVPPKTQADDVALFKSLLAPSQELVE
jgi:hypothetical protein